MKTRTSHLQFLLKLGIAASIMLSSALHAATYYVSPAGDDTADGLSTQTAWSTLGRVNSHNFAAGEQVLLEGGATFTNGLYFGTNDVGSAADPIVVGSYGEGRATIRPTGDVHPIFIYNTAGIVIENLVLEGIGITNSTKSGLFAYIDLPAETRMAGLTIRGCEIRGLLEGITIGAWASDGSFSGFKDVLIESNLVHTIRQDGIGTWGMYPGSATEQSHRNITIRECEVYGVTGNPEKTDNHSGSGIIMSGVMGGLIDRCYAHDNGGSAGTLNGGGPVGIWTWNSDSVTIQRSLVHNQKTTPGIQDGGGFDIDGGATGALIQYCYSYLNEGSGYLVAAFSGSTPITNATFRYNISWCDSLGERTKMATGFTVWRGGGIVSNVTAYNNLVYTKRSTAAGLPVVAWTGGVMSDIHFWNNVFVVNDGDSFVKINNDDARSYFTFQNNVYWAVDDNYTGGWLWGQNVTFDSLADWRQDTYSPEMRNGQPVGLMQDPRIADIVIGAQPTSVAEMEQMMAFRLLVDSPLLNAGLDLRTAEFGSLDVGARDFFGGNMPSGETFDIGPHERMASLTITESGGSTDISEDGVTDTYDVVLNSQPTADVTITITGDAQVNVSPASLTFTDANWDSPQTVTVSAVDDSNDEGTHTGTITHSASSADVNYDGITISSVTANITDNDTRGNVGFSSASYSVSEDGTSVWVYVTRTSGSNDAVSVDYVTVDGTAAAGTDYDTASGTLYWANGSMVTNHFDVIITDNTLYTGDRAFAVRLRNPVGGVGLALTNATVTILEDEVLPSVPLGLVATPSVGQVDLVWAAASEATGYKVKRATSPGGPFDATLGTSVTTNYPDTSASDGTIYYYVVAATNPAGESANSSVAGVTLPNLLPFVEDFEAPVSIGDLAGQRLWVASNAVVQAGVGLSGSQGLNLGTGTAQQSFANGTNTVTVSVWCKPVPGEDPAAVDADSSAVFWVDTNLNVRVFSNTTAVTLPVQIDTNTWTHFEATVDYAARTWQLSVDGGTVISGLGLYSVRTNFTTILFENTTGKAFFIDDINVTSAAAPPTPYENWLSSYGFTTEDDGLLSSNGVNTIREAYIAGLDPTNAASVFAVTSIGNESGTVITWGNVSGRLYNVYWSSNLLGGASSFQILDSNIPWNVNSITDTVHSANNAGFYRIDVQLDE